MGALPHHPEYRISGGYSATSIDTDVIVRRTGTGAYTVVLEGAATSGGVAHVVAYGGGPVHCTVPAYYRSLFGDDHLIQVRCFAATGSPVDSRFVMTFTNRRSVHQGRLAWFATDQTAPTGLRTLPSTYRYDSTGGAISYERLAKGRYRFHLNPNPDSENGPIFPMTHVTALGSTAVNCQADWPDGRIVRCANAAGLPVDARFAVTYGSRVDLLGHSAGPRFASGTLYGEHSSGGAINGDSYNSTLPGYGGAAGTLLGTGFYQMTFTGTGTTFGTAFVNAHSGMSPDGPSRGHCVLVSWTRAESNTVIRVRCYSWLGVPANLNARISYTSWPAV
ncbi:hypothetical protein GA0070616_2992 [Micromonospora nigra]|uniref:Uncharacterized protein n=1 Tax=Micromonospora nigra TaxID=145857 RepID=A0A1C6S5X0_9ACTN|nr:hypothetical protein [Micromonospora nigra]SCL24833.1 hypothetical protein GA0070616_2992 [Micromonospora nigra]